MEKSIDLISFPKKSFWKLSIPIIAFSLFDAVYGLIDMYWISRMSHEAYFAIGIAIPIFTLICSFGSSIGQGTNSIMSRYIGYGDLEKSYNSLWHGIILCFIIWILILISTLFLSDIISLIHSSKSNGLIIVYLTPLCLASLVFILSNLFSETFQAEGNSRIPTALIITTNILNIILDPIFIFNFQLGIYGAAFATIISSSVTVIVLLGLYLINYTKVPLKIKYFEFNMHIISEITKVAIPNFLDSAIWCILAIFVNRILMSDLGPFGIILYSASGKIKDFLMAPVKGMGKGLMSVSGHLFGARKIDKLVEMYNYTLKYSLIVCIILAISFLIFNKQAYGVFSVTHPGTDIIAIFAIPIILSMPFSMISSKMLDGFGKSYYSLLFTVLKIGFEIVVITVLNNILILGSSVLVGLTITEIVFAAVYYVLLRIMFKRFKQHADDLVVV